MDTGFTIRKATLDDCTALTDLCMRSKQSNGYDDVFMAMCAEELKVRDSWIEEHDGSFCKFGDEGRSSKDQQIQGPEPE